MASTKLKSLYLIDVLRELTDEEHRLTAPEITEELQKRGVTAERKSVYRDLDLLTEYGLDIVKTGSGYYLNKRKFEPWELKLLSSAVQAASFITEERSRVLLKKLSSLTSRYKSAELDRTAGLFGVKCKNDEACLNIQTVSAAITARRQISFLYTKRDINKRSVLQRSGERYRVSPYAMIWGQDRYYLVCCVEGHDALTHFRLDRMKNVLPDARPWRHFREVSPYTEVFPAAEYAMRTLNMFGGTPAHVTLRASVSLMSELVDRFGEDIPVKRDPKAEGWFFATVYACPNEGLMGYLAQFGPAVQITDPPELRDTMRTMLERTLSAYREQQ